MRFKIDVEIPQWTKWMVGGIAIGLALGLGAWRVYAATVSVKTNWQPGDTLKSADINANFQTLQDALNVTVHNAGNESIAGVKTFTSNSPLVLNHGSTDDTTFTNIAIQGGDNTERVGIRSFTTTGITTAKKIFDLSQYGVLLLVTCSDGADYSTDLVWAAYGGTPAVISAFTGMGTPSARTYSIAAGDLKVALASGTYTATVLAFEMRSR